MYIEHKILYVRRLCILNDSRCRADYKENPSKHSNLNLTVIGRYSSTQWLGLTGLSLAQIRLLIGLPELTCRISLVHSGSNMGAIG